MTPIFSWAQALVIFFMGLMVGFASHSIMVLYIIVKYKCNKRKNYLQEMDKDK